MQKVLVVMIPVFFNAAGQIFLKKGMNTVGTADPSQILPFFLASFKNVYVLVGFFLYFMSALIWMIVLTKVELSFAYPILSVGYVLILVASRFFLGEQINLVRWVGVIVIILGVVLISRS